MRDRESAGDRKKVRDRETERQRQRDRERQRETETETERQRDRDRDRETERQRETETERQRQRLRAEASRWTNVPQTQTDSTDKSNPNRRDKETTHCVEGEREIESCELAEQDYLNTRRILRFLHCPRLVRQCLTPSRPVPV